MCLRLSKVLNAQSELLQDTIANNTGRAGFRTECPQVDSTANNSTLLIFHASMLDTPSHDATPTCTSCAISLLRCLCPHFRMSFVELPTRPRPVNRRLLPSREWHTQECCSLGRSPIAFEAAVDRVAEKRLASHPLVQRNVVR